MVSKILASIIIVFRNFIFLVFSPYKTLRKISQEKDYSQLLIILLLVFLYFKFIYYLREPIFPATVIFLFFMINFLIMISLFYLLSKMFYKKIMFSSFLFTFMYSLLPTFIWFVANSLFFYFLPPPRTMSFLGRGFSIFFIAFSLSLLLWKIILIYLSLRFSSRQGFYRIIFMICIYLVIFIPVSILFSFFKIFRIPFI